MRSRVLSWLATLVAALPVIFLGAVASAPAQAAPPARLPLTVVNNSGRAEQVHLYVQGKYGGR